MPLQMREERFLSWDTDDDASQKPNLQWRSHGNALYSNWLNYYVYQTTPYDFIDTAEIVGK